MPEVAEVDVEISMAFPRDLVELVEVEMVALIRGTVLLALQIQAVEVEDQVVMIPIHDQVVMVARAL